MGTRYHMRDFRVSGLPSWSLYQWIYCCSQSITGWVSQNSDYLFGSQLWRPPNITGYIAVEVLPSHHRGRVHEHVGLENGNERNVPPSFSLSPSITVSCGFGFVCFAHLHRSPVLFFCFLKHSGTCHFPEGPEILKRPQAFEALFLVLDSFSTKTTLLFIWFIMWGLMIWPERVFWWKK